MIPSAETLTGDGADSLDKNPKWMEGKYAGIFEWDSSASKFEKSLSEGQEFIVGNYFADMGEYHGGFTKVSLAFAIANTAADKQAAAQLIEFLLNSDEGAKLMDGLSYKDYSIEEAAEVLYEGITEVLAK